MQCRVGAHRRRHAEPRLTRTEFERLVDAVTEATAESALVVGITRRRRTIGAMWRLRGSGARPATTTFV
jgi:hypothetical protein